MVLKNIKEGERSLNRIISKIYTDIEVALVAKLAYMDFYNYIIVDFMQGNNNTYPTINEMLNYVINSSKYGYNRDNIYELYTSFTDDGSDANNAVKSLLGEDSDGNAVDLAQCTNCKVVGVKDENYKNGFYGVAFETYDDSVILSAFNANIYKLKKAVSLDVTGHPDSFYESV